MHPARRLIQQPRKSVEAFAIKKGARVLELGAGPGYFTAEAAAAAGAEGMVICVDLQRGMLDVLRQRLPADLAPRVRMVNADAMHLPFRHTCIDHAFLVSVLGEIPDQARAVQELHRVLRPGGIVSFEEGWTDPDYVTRGQLRRQCAQAGLRFVDVHRRTLGYIMRFARVPAQ